MDRTPRHTYDFIYSLGGGGGELVHSDSPPPRSCLLLADKVILWLVPGAQGRVRVRAWLSGPDLVLRAESRGWGRADRPQLSRGPGAGREGPAGWRAAQPCPAASEAGCGAQGPAGHAWERKAPSLPGIASLSPGRAARECGQGDLRVPARVIMTSGPPPGRASASARLGGRRGPGRVT